MNTLKTGLFTLGLLLGTATFAQQPTLEDKANRQTEKLAQDLALSADQKAKVAELNIGIARKNDAILNNPNLTADQKKEHLQGNNNAQREQLKMILTEEQYKTYTTTVEPKQVHNETMKKSVEK